MVRSYKILVGLIFTFPIAHLLYPLFDRTGLSSAASVMWFLSGGLAMFFNGCINLIHLVEKTRFARLMSVVTNAVMLLFLIILCMVISEIQVFVLTFVLLLTLIVSVRSSCQI